MTAPAPFPEIDGTEPCRTGDPERFFRGGKNLAKPVKEECEGCHVREQCLAFALSHVTVGIWGATTAPERRAMRKTHGIRPVNLEASVASSEDIIRAHQRGMSLLSIAAFTGRTPNAATGVISQWRVRQRNLAAAS